MVTMCLLKKDGGCTGAHSVGLKMGYFQVRIKKEDTWKITFEITQRFLEWLAMQSTRKKLHSGSPDNKSKSVSKEKGTHKLPTNQF